MGGTAPVHSSPTSGVVQALDAGAVELDVVGGPVDPELLAAG